MVVEYQKIREELEADGYKVEDEEYPQIVEYARRKARSAGKDESYLPLLLPDVIREWLTRRAINLYSIAVMEVEKIYQM